MKQPESVKGKQCERCKRRFPWGITSADSICFICRWPSHWSVLDRGQYEQALEEWKANEKKKAEVKPKEQVKQE